MGNVDSELVCNSRPLIARSARRFWTVGGASERLFPGAAERKGRLRRRGVGLQRIWRSLPTACRDTQPG